MRHSGWIDKGSTPVISLIVLSLLAFLGFGVGLGIAFASQQSRLQLVADLSALAASDSRIGLIAGFPCPNAAEIALLNGANLQFCRIVGGVASVEVGKNFLGLSLFASAEAAPSE